MEKLSLNSCAKINLFLNVKNKRSDGYHELESVFERVSLCDRLILRSRADGKIVFRCSHPGVPAGADNLAVKAALALRKTSGISRGVTIELNKRIPIGAGMGGGSSNAAAVLTGLNKLWSLNLPKARLAQIAAEIGSDVPFFVYDCAFAQVKGRGERIKPLPDAQTTRLWHVIAVPDIHVSTPLIYKQWDKLSANKKNRASVLTMPPSDAKLILLALSGQKLGLSRISLFNSLEPAAISLFPQVRKVKEVFLALGIDKVLMSGSGPAVFGVVPTRKEAQSFSKRLKSKHKLWRVIVAKTV